MLGVPLQNLSCSLQLVTLIKYKKELSGGTAYKVPVIIFSFAAFVGLPREANIGKKNRELGGGTPFKILVVCFS